MPDNSRPARVVCNDPLLAERVRELLHEHSGMAQVLCDPQDCSEAPLCRWLDEQPLAIAGRVQATLQEVVELLHGTRHAFKSREVGQARARLRELMDELSAPGR